jgi:integrase
MARKTITKLMLERNPPKGVPYEEQRDANSPLILRVSSSGAKSFWVRTRIAGKGQPLRVLYPGPATIESLSDARVWAARTVQECKAGHDPRQTAEAKAKADALAAGQAERQKWTNVVADYISFIKTAKLRTADETERMFQVYVLPRWGEISVLDTDGDEINALLDDVAARKIVFEGRAYGGLVIADRLLRLIRACLKWYASKKNRKFHPPSTDGMERSNARDRKRSRILTDDEIRAAWASAPADTFGGVVKELLLTAQRRDEVGGMGRSEIDRNANWTIPPERYKTKKPQVVPLTAAALAVIDAQDRINGGDLIFSTTGNTPFSGYSKCKAKLDADMLAHLRQAAKERGNDPAMVTLPEWRLHDLRRTAKTLMSRAGVRPDISERVLGHVIKGVEGVYDQWEYLDEKRAALEALAALLDRIVNPPAENVVQLRAAE